MFGLRLPELLLILAVVVIIFGANKIPQLGAGLGQGLRSFKKALSGGDEEPETKDPPRIAEGKPADPARSAAEERKKDARG